MIEQGGPRRQRYLVVRLAGKEFALEAWTVLGLMEMRGLEVQECMGPPGWRGLVKWQGKLLPVYWPNRRLGLAERPRAARACLVLLGGKEKAGDVSWAMRVDSVSRYEDLARVHVREGRQVRLGGKWRPVLEVDRIWREWLVAGD